MYATKRKFQSLFSTITNNASPASVASGQEGPSEDPSPQTKKRRLAIPVSRYPNPRSTIVDVGGNITATESPNSATQKLPNYAPWDRGQFLERLVTYRQVDKWSAKPSKVNEVEWSKRGWSCVGKERVGCVGGCGREVVIKLERTARENTRGVSSEDLLRDNEDDEWMAEADEQMVEKYSEMIITEHEENCLWRIRGCDETIQRLPLSSPQIALSDLRSRYMSLNAISKSIPKNLAVPSSEILQTILKHSALVINSSTTETAQLPADGDHSDKVNEEAFLMALFGWRAEPESNTGLASCSACFRRLGLWLFSQISRNKEDDGETSMSYLDIVAEHRDYCPWIDASSQSARSSSVRKRLPSLGPQLAGWEALLRVLRAHLRSLDGKLVMEHDAGASANEESQEGSILEEEDEDIDVREKKEKERWARLRQLKKVFEVKRIARPKTAGSNTSMA